DPGRRDAPVAAGAVPHAVRARARTEGRRRAAPGAAPRRPARVGRRVAGPRLRDSRGPVDVTRGQVVRPPVPSRRVTSVREAGAEDWPGIWQVLEPTIRAGETYTYPRDLDEAGARTAWTGEP